MLGAPTVAVHGVAPVAGTYAGYFEAGGTGSYAGYFKGGGANAVYVINTAPGASGSGIKVESEGSGIGAAALSANALAAGGIGLVAQNNSNDATIVGRNKGSGQLFKLYSGADWNNLRFKVTNTGEVYADGTFHSGGADFAELYPAKGKLAPGTVVGIGEDGRLEPATSKRAWAVMGVVSDNPTIVGGSAIDAEGNSGKVPVAILGIVEVRASAASGPIAPGDLLTAGTTPGTAEKAVWAYPGTIIGKALAPLREGTGKVKMLVILR